MQKGANGSRVSASRKPYRKQSKRRARKKGKESSPLQLEIHSGA